MYPLDTKLITPSANADEQEAEIVETFKARIADVDTDDELESIGADIKAKALSASARKALVVAWKARRDALIPTKVQEAQVAKFIGTYPEAEDERVREFSLRIEEADRIGDLSAIGAAIKVSEISAESKATLRTQFAARLQHLKTLDVDAIAAADGNFEEVYGR